MTLDGGVGGHHIKKHRVREEAAPDLSSCRMKAQDGATMSLRVL